MTTSKGNSRLADRSSRIVLLALLPGLLLSQCQRGVTDEEYQRIEDWLHCGECIAEERTAVVALGEDAIPVLRSLVGQVPDTWRVREENRLRLQWRQFPIPDLPEDSFVARAYPAFQSRVQGRAATSLGDLGAYDELRRALREGTGGYTPDALAEIQAALVGAGGEGRLSGVVLDPTGNPYPGVTVAANRCATTGMSQRGPVEGRCEIPGSPGETRTFQTGANGEYSLAVGEGIWEVWAIPGSVGRDTASSSPQLALLLHGETVYMDTVRLSGGPGSLPESGAVQGIVILADGSPADNVAVAAVQCTDVAPAPPSPTAGSCTDNGEAIAAATARTDPNGSYVLDLWEGTWAVQVTPPAGQPTSPPSQLVAVLASDTVQMDTTRIAAFIVR